MLETVINAASHKVIFYPKFHCELNYIEHYWGAVKRVYSGELPVLVSGAGEDSVELKTIRRFAARSKRRMMAYINGLTVGQREYAGKRYKSHRRADRDVFV